MNSIDSSTSNLVNDPLINPLQYDIVRSDTGERRAVEYCALEGHVLYSVGGYRGSCSVKTWKRWAKSGSVIFCSQQQVCMRRFLATTVMRWRQHPQDESLWYVGWKVVSIHGGRDGWNPFTNIHDTVQLQEALPESCIVTIRLHRADNPDFPQYIVQVHPPNAKGSKDFHSGDGRLLSEVLTGTIYSFAKDRLELFKPATMESDAARGVR